MLEFAKYRTAVVGKQARVHNGPRLVARSSLKLEQLLRQLRSMFASTVRTYTVQHPARTDLPGGSPKLNHASLSGVQFKLPDEAIALFVPKQKCSKSKQFFLSGRTTRRAPMARSNSRNFYDNFLSVKSYFPQRRVRGDSTHMMFALLSGLCVR